MRMHCRVVAVALIGLIAGCGAGDDGDGGAGQERARPVVFTTFYPTTYFTQRIARDLVEVVCPVPPDEDAIFWNPDAETVERYQKADLIVVNGAAFEKWVLRTSLPPSRIVDTAKPFADRFVLFQEAVTHQHGPAGEHAHEGIDGHTWLDPKLARLQADRIREALKRLLPRYAEDLDENFEALAADLDTLDAALIAMKAGYDGHAILASHPAYNYLARQYGLNIVNLDLDPESMPDDATFEAVRTLLAEKPAKHLLWESAPTEEIAARFRSDLGLTSVVFSPCELMDPADLAAGEDYLSVMKANLARLDQVLR